MPVKALTYHQRYYRANPEYQERAKKGAAERNARIKREGGDELRIVQIRKALYQRRQILNKHLDAVEHQERHIFPLVDELQVLLKRRAPRG